MADMMIWDGILFYLAGNIENQCPVFIFRAADDKPAFIFFKFNLRVQNRFIFFSYIDLVQNVFSLNPDRGDKQGSAARERYRSSLV